MDNKSTRTLGQNVETPKGKSNYNLEQLSKIVSRSVLRDSWATWGVIWGAVAPQPGPGSAPKRHFGIHFWLHRWFQNATGFSIDCFIDVLAILAPLWQPF